MSELKLRPPKNLVPNAIFAASTESPHQLGATLIFGLYGTAEVVPGWETGVATQTLQLRPPRKPRLFRDLLVHGRGCGVGRWPLHDEGERNQKGDQNGHDRDRVLVCKRGRLLLHHEGDARIGLMQSQTGI